jgi:ATP-dependent Lon protease
MTNSATDTVLPVLPLKNNVLFPRQAMPLVVGRASSMSAVSAALATEDKLVLVVAQQTAEVDDPALTDLYRVGTIAVIKRMVPADGVMQIIVQGIERAELLPVAPPAVATASQEPAAPSPEGGYLQVVARRLPQPDDWDDEVEALHRESLSLANRILEKINPEAQAALGQMVQQVSPPLHQVYLLSTLLSLDTEKDQQLLMATTQAEAVRLIYDHLSHEVRVLEIRHQIASQAQTEMTREHREYMLRKQLRAIQEELGEQSPERADLDELRRRLEESLLPDEIRPDALRELSRLERLPTASPDYQLTRGYVELIGELPWNALTADNLDLDHARQVLDEDHFGLEKVKDRIIEHLAVLKLNPQANAPILCFVGPPGVGKTSLGHSIARALGRKFERLSLGGVSDEAELRGHRRTYIGAMPGRIIQAIRHSGARNPLIMLDEIDKLGRDFRGDPAAALLEILDPAQNSTFRDNYLNLPFDLSKVMFIATANSLDTIPGPLLDRVEMIRLAGYSDGEKARIARQFLFPRRMHEAGLADGQIVLSDEILLRTIRGYTREAGVRQLERVLGSICRKVAKRVAEGDAAIVTLDDAMLQTMLGPYQFLDSDVRPNLQPGVAAGLAWTPAGGDVLYIEAVALPHSRELTLTGQLGDVMKESAKTAQSFIRSQWAELDLDKQALSNGVHLHVPAGATPKDGPSAGVAIATALASLYTYLPVRSDVAMTGEITLTGLVLPVGGIKEKVLAAHRAGLRHIILPEKNRRDIEEIPAGVRSELNFKFVTNVRDVLSDAIPQLGNRLAHVDW